MENENDHKVALSQFEERLIRTLQLLGDATRFRMFKLLTVDSDRCVTDIAGELNVTVSAVSQHFRTFELLGLVDKRRMGQKICYGLKRGDALVEELVRLSDLDT